MKYYELPKLTEITDTSDELMLWLTPFSAKTEEDINRIEAMGVPIMNQAINAYKSTTSTEEFQRLEEMRFEASVEEASHLGYAIRKEQEKWKKVVDEKDAEIADYKAEVADYKAEVAALKAQFNII